MMQRPGVAAQRTMTVAGVMSGTSADGVDVALVRITPRPAEPERLRTAEPERPRMKLIGLHSVPYSKTLRTAVLAAMNARSIAASDLARLHWRLGEVYGDAVVQAATSYGVRINLVGVHGQTVFHGTTPVKFLGAPVRCTWQLGESSAIAASTGLPVVSDFRTADVALGGQGAPLVPVFDRAYFSDRRNNRILQNLGGIANMTALPAASGDVLAFDSGPASVLIDAAMQKLYGRAMDRNGAVAARGVVVRKVLERTLTLPYFTLQPPKSCGREEFDSSFLSQLITACRKRKATDADIIATLTALTSESILAAYRNFVWPFLGQRAPLADATEYIVSGGGSRNATLMRLLRDGLQPLGVDVKTSGDLGIPSQAKEAMAFALLAWLRWHELPGNVPSATGASRNAILGKVTLP